MPTTNAVLWKFLYGKGIFRAYVFSTAVILQAYVSLGPSDSRTCQIQPFQTVVEDIFIWSLGPKRRVNPPPPFNRALELEMCRVGR